MHIKQKAAIAAVVVAVAAGAFYLINHRQPESDRIKVSGNVEITTVATSFKIPGRVVSRDVDEGDWIKAGQMIARLDSSDLEKEVALRRGELDAANASLAELLAGSRKEEIGQAEANLARTEAEATRAELDLKRTRSLYDREVVAKRDLDNARASAETTSAAVRQAREGLILTRKGPRRERIDQARAMVEQAQAGLALARERLSYATLTAPMNGTVVAKNIEPGEQVAPGTPIVTIGDLEDTWVRAYISETDLGRVKLGQSALVTTDTYPGKSYPGKVTFISPEAEFTPKNVQTEKERVKLVYRIKVSIPNPKMELKPGMPADVEILTGASGAGTGSR